MPREGRIGWIGFGKMGAPICARLHAAGHAVVALDARSEAAARIRAAGMDVADDLRDVAMQCRTIFTSLPDDRALTAVVGGSEGLAMALSDGHLVVDTSTVSPDASAAAAAAVEARGAWFLRAPVSGSITTAEAGTLSVLASGPRPSFDRAEPLLKTFSQSRFYLGPGEEARYLKLVLNTMVGVTSALIAEALTLGRKGGLDTATMLEVITRSAVASPLIAYKRPLLETGNFDAAFSVEQMMKDLDLILTAARAEHCPMFLTALVRQHYETALARGQGDKDFFVLYEEFGKLAGL